MTDEINNIAQIEEYLKGNLTGKTLSDFEARIASDPELAKEVELQREIYSGIERLGDKELADELNKIHASKTSNNPFGITQRQKKLFFYALGGLILIFVGWHTFTNMSVEEHEQEITKVVLPTETSDQKEEFTTDTTESVELINMTDSLEEQPERINPETNTTIEITKFTNPIVLGKTFDKIEYIFSYGELKLFGADNLDLNKLEIIRHKNQILLFDQKQFYPLEEKHKRDALIADPAIRIFETFKTPGKNSPKMKIIKTNLELKEELEFTSIRVIKKQGLTGKKYRYTGVTIEVTEQLYELFGNKFELIHVEELNQDFFKTKEGLFHLEKDTKDFVEVIKVHDPKVQKVFKSEEKLVPLKSETIEGGYGHGRHPGN